MQHVRAGNRAATQDQLPGITCSTCVRLVLLAPQPQPVDWDFQRLGFPRVDFQRMDLQRVDFQGVDLQRVVFKGVDFQRMELKSVDSQGS